MKEARGEVIQLYQIVKKQAKLISNIENGVYSNGLKSVHIPMLERVVIPERAKMKFLNRSLNKTGTLVGSIDNNLTRAYNKEKDRYKTSDTYSASMVDMKEDTPSHHTPIGRKVSDVSENFDPEVDITAL